MLTASVSGVAFVILARTPSARGEGSATRTPSRAPALPHADGLPTPAHEATPSRRSARNRSVRRRVCSSSGV
ncbi:hypothetical protein GCM10010252_13130 [Streptomyces aureoverticillatus]|nr:hypothetical protein GCM10010252_13130 [Streptomyces aureoverticillatus]